MVNMLLKIPLIDFDTEEVVQDSAPNDNTATNCNKHVSDRDSERRKVDDRPLCYKDVVDHGALKGASLCTASSLCIFCSQD